MNLDLSKRILDWNHADFKLYDYFNKTFWSKVDMFGRDKMEQELINFREKQKEAEHECIESYQVWPQKYTLKNNWTWNVIKHQL